MLKHVILLAIGLAGAALAEPGTQLKLSDDLDFPGEGYCVDVLGVGATARADLPLVAHNCLPERASEDRHVVAQGARFQMPAFDACLTAFGVVRPLPGAAVILRPCGAQESFLPAADLQDFERLSTGQLRLVGSTLCLAVGPEVARTFSATHRWRVLSLQPCARVPRALSVWE